LAIQSFTLTLSPDEQPVIVDPLAAAPSNTLQVAPVLTNLALCPVVNVQVAPLHVTVPAPMFNTSTKNPSVKLPPAAGIVNVIAAALLVVTNFAQSPVTTA
jgi:hypothetical protein